MLDVIAQYWVQIYAFISTVLLLVNWSLGKTYSKKDDVEKVDKRVTLLENEFKHLPSKDQIHVLDKQITELSSQLKTISPQLTSMQRMTEMLTENELQQGQKNGS